jgi:dihydroneopterin aldolase
MLKSSLTKLTIQNAEYFAYHGVKKEEQKLGGKYQVDIELYYDAKSAVVNDDVNYALNYEEVMYCISEVMTSESYSLVETVANEILNMLFEKFEALKKGTVRVRKYSVPIRSVIKCIEIEQSMERE